jgi:hypothetical protein
MICCNYTFSIAQYTPLTADVKRCSHLDHDGQIYRAGGDEDIEVQAVLIH